MATLLTGSVGTFADDRSPMKGFLRNYKQTARDYAKANRYLRQTASRMRGTAEGAKAAMGQIAIRNQANEAGYGTIGGIQSHAGMLENATGLFNDKQREMALNDQTIAAKGGGVSSDTNGGEAGAPGSPGNPRTPGLDSNPPRLLGGKQTGFLRGSGPMKTGFGDMPSESEVEDPSGINDPLIKKRSQKYKKPSLFDSSASMFA